MLDIHMLCSCFFARLFVLKCGISAELTILLGDTNVINIIPFIKFDFGGGCVGFFFLCRTCTIQTFILCPKRSKIKIDFKQKDIIIS